MHPATADVVRYFAWQHLPADLQRISRPFADLAVELATELPEVPQTTVALQRLLESKDAAVRAALPKPDPEPALDTRPVMTAETAAALDRAWEAGQRADNTEHSTEVDPPR